MRAESVGAAETPLRIAYVFQQFPLPTETFAVSDIEALLSQEHRVSIYTLKPPTRLSRRLFDASAVARKLPVNRPSLRGALSWPRLLWRRKVVVTALAKRLLSSFFKTPKVSLEALLCLPRIIEIAESLQKTHADVVHVFWARHVGLILPVLQNAGYPALRSTFLGTHDLVFDDVLVELTMESAEIVFSHADVNRQFVEARAKPNTSVEIIRRGIPLSKLDPESSRDRLRLVTASSLIRPKNVDGVIRAFASVRATEPRLTLDIFGDGPERPRLGRLCADLGLGESVRFHGHITREALFDQLQKASTFILLSKARWDRLPNVLKEALWAGCTVVSSNSEGIRELIPDEEIGFVVDPDDPAAVQAVLQTALSETEESASIRRNRARRLIAHSFSADTSMRSYAHAWQSALNMKVRQRIPRLTSAQARSQWVQVGIRDAV